jgi:phosphatidate phosphatase APP1
VYTFDIDQTYLKTSFNSPAGLLKIPFELAIDKTPYPGVAELIRACQRGGAASGSDRPAYFLSASPSQMREVLEQRLIVDQISLDGLTLKNWAAFLSPRRWRALTEQLPYKLAALLETRRELPAKSFEILFGDDTEADEAIYSLYRDVAGGQLKGEALRRRLDGVAGAETDRLAALVEALEPNPGVRHVFIHALRRPDAQNGNGVEHYRSPLVPAEILAGEGLLDEAGVAAVKLATREVSG